MSHLDCVIDRSQLRVVFMRQWLLRAQLRTQPFEHDQLIVFGRDVPQIVALVEHGVQKAISAPRPLITSDGCVIIAWLWFDSHSPTRPSRPFAPRSATYPTFHAPFRHIIKQHDRWSTKSRATTRLEARLTNTSVVMMFTRFELCIQSVPHKKGANVNVAHDDC